jgi:hypothetical protein
MPKPFFQAFFNLATLKFKEKQLLLITEKRKNNCRALKFDEKNSMTVKDFPGGVGTHTFHSYTTIPGLPLKLSKECIIKMLKTAMNLTTTMMNPMMEICTVSVVAGSVAAASAKADYSEILHLMMAV